jgi:hypothetical protein
MDDLLEADFWPASLKVHPGHNFRVARHSALNLRSGLQHPREMWKLALTPASRTLSNSGLGEYESDAQA